jgi:hypothetical protein
MGAPGALDGRAHESRRPRSVILDTYDIVSIGTKGA